MHVAALYRYSTRRTTQLRSDRAREHAAADRDTYTISTLPEALPCHKFDGLFAHDADVWGNIVVRDAEELQRWVELCQPTSREVAETRGRCVVYHPKTVKQQPPQSQQQQQQQQQEKTPAEPQYFCLTATDDAVYGRASYMADTPDASVSETLVEKMHVDPNAGVCEGRVECC